MKAVESLLDQSLQQLALSDSHRDSGSLGCYKHSTPCWALSQRLLPCGLCIDILPGTHIPLIALARGMLASLESYPVSP